MVYEHQEGKEGTQSPILGPKRKLRPLRPFAHRASFSSGQKDHGIQSVTAKTAVAGRPVRQHC